MPPATFDILSWLQWGFFGLFGFAVVILLLWFRRTQRVRTFLGARLFFLLSFLALFLYQGYWQLTGARSLDFQKFLRRYDQRPATQAAYSTQRGAILDRTGKLLSRAKPGKRWERIAPLGAAAMPLLGYSHSRYGLSNLERVLDTVLSGFDTLEGATATSPQSMLQRHAPTDVRLSIDAELQHQAYTLLRGRKGAVVVLNPLTGEILALASSPAVDYSQLPAAMTDNARAPLLNRATQGLYAPGSTFKLFTAAVALERNLTPDLACPNTGWSPAPYTPPIRESHHNATEVLSLDAALIHSSNIYFAKLAQRLGYPTLAHYAASLHLTEALTVAHQRQRAMETAAPTFPDLSASPNATAYIGFGQGDLLLSPLHIAALTTTFANGGYYVNPTLLAGQRQEPQRVWKPATAQHVQRMMRSVVTSGTALKLKAPVAVCAKTGTAENATGRDHAWFTCYAPAQAPQLVITVLVESSGYGAAVAMPIAQELLNTYFKRPDTR